MAMPHWFTPTIGTPLRSPVKSARHTDATLDHSNHRGPVKVTCQRRPSQRCHTGSHQPSGPHSGHQSKPTVIAMPQWITPTNGRLRWGARNGRSSPLGPAGPVDMAARACFRARSDIEPARLRWGARNGRSSLLGSAGMAAGAARLCLAPDMLLALGRLHQRAQNCSATLLNTFFCSFIHTFIHSYIHRLLRRCSDIHTYNGGWARNASTMTVWATATININ